MEQQLYQSATTTTREKVKNGVRIKLLSDCLQYCDHGTVTASDVKDINSVLDKRTWFYWTDYSQASEAFEMFRNGSGHVRTGGFDFEFRKTNSFNVWGNEWSLHISNTALFMILCIIFGLVTVACIVTGVPPSIVLGPVKATCTIQ